LRIIAISVTAFIVAILTLILIPREATRTARQLVEEVRSHPDTVVLARRVEHMHVDLAAAESALARRRARVVERARSRRMADSLTALARQPAQAARRDSLVADRAELQSLIAHASWSPLSTSYRALASARGLHDNARVRTLLDSLNQIAAVRDTMTERSAGNPQYLALTTHLNAIGQSLERVAASRDTALDVAIAALTPPVITVDVSGPARDTLRAHAHVDSIRRVLALGEDGLARGRRLDAQLDMQLDKARAIANGSAPPFALMGAALVLGLAIGFVVTLTGELRTPRVSDAAEASRVTGVPTLATIVPRPTDPERMRRSADRTVSPLIAVNSETYRYVYLAVSGADAAAELGFPLVAVMGDEAEVVATVAANIAVASAHDSRTTLLIDADTRVAATAAIVGVARAPGVSDVLAGRADWAHISVSATVGRDRSLTVMPAGTLGQSSAVEAGVADTTELREELIRLGRRYDLVVVATPEGTAQIGPDGILPVRDVVVCARVAYTPIARLAMSMASLYATKLRVRGIILWDADLPPRLIAS
jgi:hypothetical protein